MLPTTEAIDTLRDWIIRNFKETTSADPDGWKWVTGFLQDFYDTDSDHLRQRLQRII